MKYKIQRVKFITCGYVRSNRDKLFLFGDNLEHRGFNGQATAMRGDPHTLVIPTKKSLSYKDGSFFTDLEFDQNKTAIDTTFAEVEKAVTDSIRVIVITANGFGTGRARRDRLTPRIFAYLQQKIS